MKRTLPKPVQEAVASFLEQYPADEFGNMLRRMLLEYMTMQVRVGFPLWFAELLMGLNDLLDVLDVAAREMYKKAE